MKDGTQASEIIFSDERMFTLEVKLNSQENRILAKNANSISTHIHEICFPPPKACVGDGLGCYLWELEITSHC